MPGIVAGCVERFECPSGVAGAFQHFAMDDVPVDGECYLVRRFLMRPHEELLCLADALYPSGMILVAVGEQDSLHGRAQRDELVDVPT